MNPVPARSPVWKLSRERELTLDRPRVMAILNITPDSFSDGGVLATIASAIDAARQAVIDGADILDIGGESTRPGAQRIAEAEQVRRVVPVIAGIRAEVGEGVAITIDTTLAGVAQAAIDAGADAVNDVSAGTDDAGMLPLCAHRSRGVVLMHRLVAPSGDVFSHQYPRDPEYGAAGVVGAVRAFLAERVAAAERAGVDPDSIVIDPGLGFGKGVEQNLALVVGTGKLLTLGRPVLSALSRKSFTARAAGLAMDAPASARVHASVGLSVRHMLAGARIFRVHDVRAHAEALRAAWAAIGM